MSVVTQGERCMFGKSMKYFPQVGEECVAKQFVMSSDIVSKNGINNTY